MNDVTSEVREIVDRETRGWDTQDVGLLLSVFHPDMVWPWPKRATTRVATSAPARPPAAATE